MMFCGTFLQRLFEVRSWYESFLSARCSSTFHGTFLQRLFEVRSRRVTHSGALLRYRVTLFVVLWHLVTRHSFGSCILRVGDFVDVFDIECHRHSTLWDSRMRGAGFRKFTKKSRFAGGANSVRAKK